MNFTDFQNHIATLPNDTAALSEFLTTVKSADDMVNYAKRKGFEVSEAQATDLLARGGAVAQAQMSQLSDEELDQVTGGLSWGAIGAIAGGALAAGIVLANSAWMVPVAGTVALLTGNSIAGLIGTVGLTATAGAFSGGVVGGAIGTVADKVVNG